MRLVHLIQKIIVSTVGVTALVSGGIAVTAHAQATPQQVTAQQRTVKNQLQTYINRVTKDGTASVAFYNLGAYSNTPAGRAQSRAFYAPGKLAVYSKNAHKAYTSASTYKLFVAANIYSRIHYQNLSRSITKTTGFQEMILHSRNEFAEHYLQTHGYDRVNTFNAHQNWYSHVFATGRAARTTAATLVSVVRKLDQQQYPFNDATSRNQLLSLMRRQVYRSGIPKGAAAANKGSKVADKVGWLYSFNNDAGIVTLPNGQRYVLVVMTHGHGQSGFSGFPRIATITKNVQKIVYGASTSQKVAALYQ
ncbi:hypothetical protein GCM10022296_10960 [Secundilactobacillus similis DSM 23365 = JCM 2765]|uniref:Beta-lactamase class A n=2 Tax=Secundilactobacillus similis TaxID=414682 RepID=A0A0R2EWH9_9LACO|nr:serine hydrolase [Secundilactobacillus similis]KRN18213.1 Beta-lactamase class A [Secundilactobacillus similis DSM 23365 = JCM 2765]